MDFMLFAMDPIINQAANWFYMNGGHASVPIVFWGIINRRGEQAAQHSQAFHALFAHIPGLKVVMPATPYDAKGLMVASIEDANPVVFVDDRCLYGLSEPVPNELYSIDIGKACIRRNGKDVTIVAVSYMVHEALEASEILQKDGIDAEVIDLRTIKPLDKDLIIQSVLKTGRVLVADTGWKSFGLSAEISALIAESSEAFRTLKSPIKRVALPDCPAPASNVLENAYYSTSSDIISAVREIISQ
jgi:pyruvate dehydrogenase E1 component beta subunit